MKNYYKILILLILPIFGHNSPIDFDDFETPKLYHDHSIALNTNENKLNLKSSNVDSVKYRLPNNTKPISYSIQLKTDVHIKKLDFQGTNIITLKALEKTNTITIHARQLKIENATLYEKERPSDNSEIELEKIPEIIPENEFLIFKLKDKHLVQNKEYVLEIKYSGKLRTDNGGFYLSKYTNKNNEEIYLATTQFESTDARHGFPCYDEPGIKAKFTIQITHGKNYIALSNMPQKQSIPGDEGYKITTFEETRDMSPYLVAFVVSDFEFKPEMQNVNENKEIEHRVYSRPGTEDDRDFPLSASIKILSSIAKYVDVKYSLPKMDQISIPDFAAGAMENWGLVTYREEMLLYNEKHSTIKTKTVVANTIAHEYGHQWFGNLVSPKWWTYLWLNEGFASIFAYIGADMAYPEWDLKEHFIVAEYQRALKSDEGKNKRPMTHYVEKPSEIVGLFDSVSYSKAACVIQMMRHYVGENIFKKALNIYLNAMEYKSAEENDLFDAFQNAAKAESFELPAPFKDLMGSWSRQGGFPLLTVKRDYDKGSFTIEQKGFINPGETDDKRKWWIPYNFASANHSDFENTEARDIFNDINITVIPNENELFSKDHWLILNKQLTGYYRVNYDDKNWDLITEALKSQHSKIHKYNRAQLIFDSYRLSLAGELKIEKFFNLLEYLPAETEYSPWSSADEAFQFYKNRFHDHEKVYKNLQFFMLKNIEKIYEKLGLTDKDKDSHFDKYTRLMAINWACTAGSETCLENTNKRLIGLVEEKKEIEPNLQSVIYCNGLKKGNEKEFDYLFDRLLKSNDQAERQLLMNSLGCSHDEKLLGKFAKSSIDMNNSLRTQERINILKAIYSKSKEGFKAVVEFLKDNFDSYSKLTPGFGQTKPLDDAVKGLSNLVVSEDQEKMINELVGKVKQHEGVDKELETKVKSNVEKNLKWLKDNENVVSEYLADFFKRNSATQMVVSFMALFAVLFVSIKNAF